MNLTDTKGGAAGLRYVRIARSRPVRAFEEEIRQLYLGLLDQPVPARLLGILRAGRAAGAAPRWGARKIQGN
jgi:hypothetical protein